MYHLSLCFMHHVDFKDCIYLLFISLFNEVCPWFCVFLPLQILEIALKKSRNIKTKAKRVVGSISTFTEDFDQTRFCTLQNAQEFESLVQYRSIWVERQVNLDDLDCFVKHNLESRSWLPLCSDLMPPPAALIREFYSNLFIYNASSGGHYLTIWIRGEEFQITKQIVSEVLQVPLVQRPTYPYTESPLLVDLMSLLCERSISWDSEPRLHSHQLTEVNYLLFRKHVITSFLFLMRIPFLQIGVSFCMLSSLMVPFAFYLSLFKPSFQEATSILSSLYLQDLRLLRVRAFSFPRVGPSHCTYRSYLP